MWGIEDKSCFERRELNDGAAHPQECLWRDLDAGFETSRTESRSIVGAEKGFSLLTNHARERFLYIDNVMLDVVLELVHGEFLDLGENLQDVEVIAYGMRDGGFDGHSGVCFCAGKSPHNSTGSTQSPDSNSALGSLVCGRV